MGSEIPANIARGLVFGSALTAAQVWSPQVIVDQMSLRDFHMLKVFLSANVVSGLLFPLFASNKTINTNPRQATNLGRLGPFDGNIIGGALLGSGMALTGACPGTVFVQLGQGVPSALPVLAGGILGGVVYARIAPALQTAAAKAAPPQDETKLTLAGRFGLDPHLTLFAIEAALIAVITAVARYQPYSLAPKQLDPVLGGALIGLSQLVSLVLARTPLGISGAFEESGRWVLLLVDRVLGRQPLKTEEPTKPATRPAYKNIVFALGVVLGTIALRRIRPEFAANPTAAATQPLTLSLGRALAGGFALVFGARLAGGCTSGHGLSGAAAMSVASFVSVAAMFGGGIAFSKIFL